ARILEPALLAGGLLAQAVQLFLRAIASVRLALRDQGLRVPVVRGQPLHLEVGRVRASHDRSLVPIEPEPLEAVDDRLFALLRAARLVGVLDAEHERALVLPRPQPVEQRGAGAPGGRGREADANHRGRRDSRSYSAPPCSCSRCCSRFPRSPHAAPSRPLIPSRPRRALPCCGEGETPWTRPSPPPSP